MLRRMGPYRIVRQVGRGGLGVVYYAQDERTGRIVALKVLNQTADTVAARRLEREFKALSAIEHRNIVRVLDAGVEDDVPYLAMELVDGLPLRQWLDLPKEAGWAPRPPPLPLDDVSLEAPAYSVSQPGASVDRGSTWLTGDDEPDSLTPMRRTGGDPTTGPNPPELCARLNEPARVDRLRDVLAQVCDGLAFIHSRALVHRDVKPSNVLVEDGGCAKLVDFGLVKLMTSSGNTTATGHVVGTWRYMSPEQARSGKVDGRSDLYALGGVLYEMLAGRPAFAQTSTAMLLHAIVHKPPPRPESINPGVDPGLARIAQRLLAKSPDERYQTADEVAARLRAAGRG